MREFGIRDSGFGIRDSGFGFRVSGFVFRVSGFGFRVSGFGIGSEPPPVRTGSWMGPPQEKRAPRVGPISIVILARE